MATLLEIAQSWHKEGYVPRRTVLFAAWDASELNIAGAHHYIENPRYPLDNTVAEIQLDSLGGGGDILFVNGDEDLAASAQQTAASLGIESLTGRTDGGEHQAFLGERVPAISLSWSPIQSQSSQTDRPGDTLETVDIERLDAGGRVAGLVLLGLTEGEPAIADLLASRAEAVSDGDLDRFLGTSHPGQVTTDRFWFRDAQSLSPTLFELQTSDVKVSGGSASASVRMVLHYPIGDDESDTSFKRVSQRVRFLNTGDGWKWAGPDLAYIEEEPGFAIAYPRDEEQPAGLGLVAAQRYSDTASLLGLPSDTNATLMLFPKTEWLRASTAPSLLPNQDSWTSPGTIKLVYHSEISTSSKLDQSIAQLVLADAGVNEATAPWLWNGLPSILAEEDNPLESQLLYLPPLRRGLEAGDVSSQDAASWAAMDYLRRQIGWTGIGELITVLGQACHDGRCGTDEGLDLALTEVLDLDSAAFEVRWQTDWAERIATAQSELDVVLAARHEAVLAGDQGAFLSTVDKSVANLLIEEEHWFTNLIAHSVETLELGGEVLALLDDGSILAKVSLTFYLSDVGQPWGDGSDSFRILFTLADDRLVWAGTPFQVLDGDSLSISYPVGQESVAADLLKTLDPIHTQLAAELGVEAPPTMTIKLFEDDAAFRASIFPSFPSKEWVPAWTDDGESIKLRMGHGYSTMDSYRAALITQMGRNLLHQLGAESEWLVKGLSIYLSRTYDDGVTEQIAASSLDRVLRAVSKGTLGSLADIAPDYRLSEDEITLFGAHAWDAVRFLVHSYGREALTDLLADLSKNTNLETALKAHTGQTLAEFEAAWAESIPQAHAATSWIETAMLFDEERASQHITYLIGPDLAGRQAGSPGAEKAADYIVERFSDLGLVPAGENDTYLQTFPISFTTYLDTPRLVFIDGNGQSLDNLSYREDFSPLLNEASNHADVKAELVWVRDSYEGLDLSGKIVLCRPLESVDQHVTQATERGALGVIMIGEIENKKEYLAKRPIPVRFPAEDAIPVLELTQSGYGRLMAALELTPPVLFNSPPALPLGVSVHIQVPISTPESTETANILGLLPGSDPILSQEIIILGAHYDHLGDDPDGRRYSGANDNASGVAVLLEIAELWQENGYHPQRSVLFIAWGAQELGMLGSRHYIDNPVFPLERTVAMLQLDAVAGGSGHYMEVQGLRQQEGLLMFNMQAAEDLVDGRLKLAVPAEMTKVESTEISDIYMSPFDGLANQLLNARPSDQAPFHQLGIPSILVTWRGANEDNWPDEIADEAEPYRLGVTGRMVTLSLMMTAGQSSR